MGGGEGSYLSDLKVEKEDLPMSFHLYPPVIKQSITYFAVNFFCGKSCFTAVLV